MQKPFIYKYNGRNYQIVLKSVSFGHVLRDTGESRFGIRVATIAGENKSRIRLNPEEGRSQVIDANKDAVHKTIRLPREQEAKLLDGIDEQIKALREQREELLKTAWQKANIITVKELIELIPNDNH